MSGFGGSKAVRNYGDFSTSSTASSLFDAAFSKPVVRKRFGKFPSVTIEEPVLPSVTEEHNSPQQVFSPPISLPESSSTEGNLEDRNIEESDSEEDEPVDTIPPTQNIKKLTATTSNINSQSSSLLIKRKRSPENAYDFDEKDEPVISMKKEKKEDSESPPKTKFLPKKEHRNIPVYRHKWTENPEDEEDLNAQESTNNTHTKSIKETNARIKKVMDAQECLESGQLDDYRQDLEYMLTSLNDSDVSTNVKTLSAFTLAKKCTIRGFRHFLRNEININQILRLFPDVTKDQNLALCVSTFIYIMSRDLVQLKLDGFSLRILAQLLKIEPMEKTAETKKQIDKVWQVFNEYLEKSEVNGKRVSFEIKKENLTPSALILEALVYLLAKTPDEDFKSELLNLGCLQYVVVKLEKIILRLIHDKSAASSDILDDIAVLERCFRIIEYSTTYHKKNQHFLISHRGGVLIQMCGKLTSLIHQQLPSITKDSKIIEQYLKCLSLIGRVLCNLSHDSELCSSKLGMIDEFLKLTLETFTFITPKYGVGDCKHDLMVMTLGLLVNLAEKVNSNRSKILTSTVRLVLDNGTVSEEKALDALVKKFVIHEEKARAVDEDLDKDLFFEEAADDSNTNSDNEEESGNSQNGRLDRGKIDDMTEAEMLEVVQNAMGKASAHMEDSVVASYIALLIGCLLQQHDEYVSGVKNLLPNGSLTAIKEQLQRFQEFMKIANPKSRGSSSIGRIISLLDDLE